MSTIEGLSGHIWPIHPKPLTDELLTSWMVRIARAYGVRADWFWDFVWPHPELQVWAYLDRRAPKNLLTLLALRTATLDARVQQTTLTAFECIHAVPRFTTTLNFCRECLREDAEPYFRRCWQLPSFSFCTHHRALLYWRCPNCLEVLRPELLPPDTPSLAHCHHCRHDIRAAGRSGLKPRRPISEIAEFQERLWGILSRC